jgi:hypothetical protein
MKTLASVILMAVLPGFLAAQERAVHPKWELQGTASYQSTERSGPIPQYGVQSWSKSHSATLTPTCGYFVTENVELLAALQYSYELYEDHFQGYQPNWNTRHQVGFSVGVAYNYQLTTLFEPYLAAKVGLSWSRVVADWGYDTGWRRRQVTFPDVVLGGRLLFSPQWAGLIFIEYRRTRPVLDTYYGEWDQYETMVVGIGFSVFI